MKVAVGFQQAEALQAKGGGVKGLVNAAVRALHIPTAVHPIRLQRTAARAAVTKFTLPAARFVVYGNVAQRPGGDRQQQIRVQRIADRLLQVHLALRQPPFVGDDQVTLADAAGVGVGFRLHPIQEAIEKRPFRQMFFDDRISGQHALDERLFL